MGSTVPTAAGLSCFRWRFLIERRFPTVFGWNAVTPGTSPDATYSRKRFFNCFNLFWGRLKKWTSQTNQICPEMQVNEIMLFMISITYCPFSWKLTKRHNSVKCELWSNIKWYFVMLVHREHRILLTCISGQKWMLQGSFVVS